MKAGFYAASQGLFRMQDGMNIVGNNVANANTDGFQASRANFSDTLYTIRDGMDENTEIGHGVKLNATDLMFRSGSLKQTGRDLDFAIAGDGLFAVEDVDGNVRYTKDGNFELRNTGDGWELIDDAMGRVLDKEGNPIVPPFQEDKPEDLDMAALTEMIGVYTFPNPYGLLSDQNNYFSATDSSGEAQLDETLEKKSGWIETSSVKLSEEMTTMIIYQRAFSANAKAVQTSDELEQLINSLR